MFTASNQTQTEPQQTALGLGNHSFRGTVLLATTVSQLPSQHTPGPPAEAPVAAPPPPSHPFIPQHLASPSQGNSSPSDDFIFATHHVHTFRVSEHLCSWPWSTLLPSLFFETLCSPDSTTAFSHRSLPWSPTRPFPPPSVPLGLQPVRSPQCRSRHDTPLESSPSFWVTSNPARSGQTRRPDLTTLLLKPHRRHHLCHRLEASSPGPHCACWLSDLYHLLPAA